MEQDHLLFGVSAVAIGDRGLLIEGPPGSGKSSLALALIDRGATLIGDDGVGLALRPDGGLIASPPPNIAGKLEIRGVGIVDLKSTDAPLSLILSLGQVVERMPAELEQRELLGCSVPLLPFHFEGPNPALRAEWALRIHGAIRQ